MTRILCHNLDEVEVYTRLMFTSAVEMRGVPEAVAWSLRDAGFSPDPIPLGPRVRGFKWDIGLAQITLSPVKKMDWELLAYIHAEPLHARQAEAAHDAKTAIEAAMFTLEQVGFTYTTNAPQGADPDGSQAAVRSGRPGRAP